MFHLKVLTRFAAAHRLTMVGEKCENLHGHNWKIEVAVSGKNLDEGGVLLDFHVLKDHVNEIIERLDHKYLNELAYFQENPPSSETVARYVAEELTKSLAEYPQVKVHAITSWESDDACAIYYP